ncbi:unnamed protein product [Peniophora sp. CBMAI 1063]|nr:unnamed protein product [Peniophora sp. CBMAI 1063]
MSGKENPMGAAASSGAFVKPEPIDTELPARPLHRSNSVSKPPGSPSKVKPEPSDRSDMPVPTPPASPRKLTKTDSFAELKMRPRPSADFRAAAERFEKHASAAEIDYTPEKALQAGLSFTKVVDKSVKKLELGSKMRKDVWLREIASLKTQGAPTTMIAVCGATGAGKSSILNAVLDDNIVPTSGMRACTATVTEIAYHNKKTIEADIAFLSEKEWMEELNVLLDDLIDEDGTVKRSTNLNSDAGVAWSKVHAVYPSLTHDVIGNLTAQWGKQTAEKIVERDPRVRSKLGTTVKIVAKDSKQFAAEVGKYVDSKDPKRDRKKKDKEQKKAEKERAEKAPMTLAEILASGGHAKPKKDTSEGPAFWPLIRLVNVRCKAKALETGAILVDLPGVADANAARNNIAKDYMKKCNCIWILAPITRAVDDKTAKDLLGDAFRTQLMMDGNYDAHTITFIASKCDDVSCSEVINALGLHEDDDLMAIEDRIEECDDKIAELKPQENSAKATLAAIEKKLKELRPIKREYDAWIKAIEDGEEFTPKLLAKKAAAKKSKTSKGKKRKADDSGRKGGAKRRKADSDSEADDDDDFIVSDHDSDEDAEGSDEDAEGSDEEKDSDDEKNSDDEDSDKSDSDDAIDVDVEDEEVTVDSLKEKRKEIEDQIKTLREPMGDLKKKKKDAYDQISLYKKKKAKAQLDKNSFCAIKRSEFSRDVLKQDFRLGLKELDDAAAEARDPENFDPTVNVRNYDAIDLPVFTCSSRDYVRLKGQVKGDGEPSTFTKIEDTGIPKLQNWCHELTLSSRDRAARTFLTNLKTFANSVRQYLDNTAQITELDRATLKEKWESGATHDPEDDPWGLTYGAYDDEDDGYSDDGYGALGGFGRSGINAALDSILSGSALYTMQKSAPKVDEYGQPIGIVPRLKKEFKKIIDDTIVSLKNEFKAGLQEKCETGAHLAAAAAIEKSDTFAASMHWATYRATLRRHGSFRQDLNVELISPMTKNIASSWAQIFEADLFADFQQTVMDTVDRLTKDVESTAAQALRDRVRNQADLCLDEARLALQNAIDIVKETLNTKQKEISRLLAPHVQNELVEGYDSAMEERGPGSVARQKAAFHQYIVEVKDDIFSGGAGEVLSELDKAAEAVGDALRDRLTQLAQKVEVSIATLWEGVNDDPSQRTVREEVITTMSEVIGQIDLWGVARETRNRIAEEAAAAQAANDEMNID